jgi:cellulose synthase/poly-beta-1,6-N-acetylglucosamine synthase-like glycosyltransferase
MIEIVFWVCVGTTLWVYAGFPAAVALAGRFRNREVVRASVTPSVSLVIAAFDEEEQIARRLENALAADYPVDALEVLVASDGSTDATEEIVETFQERGVRLLRLPRQGKIPALDAAVREARGEILVFSDANTDVHPAALRALAENFADPEVGGAAGHTGYRLESGADSSSLGEGLYWRYDSWLKKMESRAGSVVSAHGGLYAIRRRLYRTPDDTAVTDDFMISTGVIAQGCRLVFEPRARAWEVTMSRADREFRRRVRLMTRGLRGVRMRAQLLNPFRYGFYSISLISHKVLRRLVAPLLPLLLLTSVLLAPRGGFYLAAATVQLLFYLLAIGGFVTRSRQLGQSKLLCVPFYYCLANAASALALVHFLRGDRIQLWQPQRHAART